MTTAPSDRFGMVLPTGGDPADVPLRVDQPFGQIDDMAAIDAQGAYSAMPAATLTRRGMYYWATDRELLYRCDGIDWRQVSTWTRRDSINGEFGDFEVGRPGFGWGWYPGEDAPLVGAPRVEVPYTGSFDLKFGILLAYPPSIPGDDLLVFGLAVKWDSGLGAYHRLLAPGYGLGGLPGNPTPFDICVRNRTLSAGYVVKLTVNSPSSRLYASHAYVEISPSGAGF